MSKKHYKYVSILVTLFLLVSCGSWNNEDKIRVEDIDSTTQENNIDNVQDNDEEDIETETSNENPDMEENVNMMTDAWEDYGGEIDTTSKEDNAQNTMDTNLDTDIEIDADLMDIEVKSDTTIQTETIKKAEPITKVHKINQTYKQSFKHSSLSLCSSDNITNHLNTILHLFMHSISFNLNLRITFCGLFRPFYIRFIY